MVIDSSALAAIFFKEPEGDHFEDLIIADQVKLISAATLFEASILIESRLGESRIRDLDLYLYRAKIAVVLLTEEHVELARSAYRRYGRGNHSARLNMGDCFSYALAWHTGEPLLYKGEDFAKTDIPAAVVRPPG